MTHLPPHAFDCPWTHGGQCRCGRPLAKAISNKKLDQLVLHEISLMDDPDAPGEVISVDGHDVA